MNIITLLLVVSLITTIVGVFLILHFLKKPTEDRSLQLMQQQLENLREQLRKSLEGSSNTISNQLKDNLEAMVNTNRTVGERLDNASKVVSELGNRMIKVEEVSKNVLEVGKDISSLQQILRAPKLRGNFGEHLLGDLLNQMLPQANFELQYMFKNGERVDAIIKTAHGFVPIDAKFPLESFQRLIKTEKEEEKKQFRKEFVTSIKKHINDIATKYIRVSEGTFDFALMYIPAENVYYEIVTKGEEMDEIQTVVEYAFSKRVFPVSPNSFYAYLNTILVGLRGMQVEKNVKKIIVELGRLKKKFGTFVSDFSRIGTHIGNANSAYGDAKDHLRQFDERLEKLDTPSLEDGSIEIEENPDSHPKELVQ